MDPQYAPQQQQQQQQAELADPDEMQHMWQFLDSTLTTGSTPNGLPPQANNTGSGDGGPAMMHAQYGPPGGSNAGSVATHPAGMHASTMMQQQQQQQQPPTAPYMQQQQISDAMRESTLNEDENGMYNELGDVFSMFFNIDSDEPQQHHLGGGGGMNAAAIAQAYAQHMNNTQHAGSFVGAPRYQQTNNSSGEGDASQKVQLARSASASSSHSGMDSISPGGLLGYPSMSPATINWLQSLAKSESYESLSGMISPATINITPGALSGSASANSLVDGADSLDRYVA